AARAPGLRGAARGARRGGAIAPGAAGTCAALAPRRPVARGRTAMSPPPDLKARVLAALPDIPAPSHSQVRRARVWLFACGVLGALAIFFAEGGVQARSRPPSLVALSSLGTAAIVGIGMWLLLTRGRSVLGRPVSSLLAAAVGASVLFVAWRYG